MKLGSFIITFNRADILADGIQRLLDQTRPPDVIVVVDNGDPVVTRRVLDKFPVGRVHHEVMSENLGPCGGAGYGAQWLYDQGCDLIHWFDDDDPPKTPDTLERLLKILADNGEEVGGAGAVGTRFDWRRGELRRYADDELHGILEVDMIGGNGHPVVRRSVIEAVGVPERKLFFGWPELQYCLRIRQGGFRLLVDGELLREYRAQAGRLEFNRRRTPVPRRSLQHMWRNYYTTRSYIYMMRRNFNRPDLARREAIKAVVRAAGSWARGPRYALAFSRLQLRGVWDGYRDRMGRTVVPNPKY